MEIYKARAHPPVLCSTLTLALERGATNVLSCWHLLNMQLLDVFVNPVGTLGHPDSIIGVCDLLVTSLWCFPQGTPESFLNDNYKLER